MGLEIPTEFRVSPSLSDDTSGYYERTVSLVDLQTLNGVGRVSMLELVGVLGGRVPEPSVINRRNVKILSDAFDPRWEAVDHLAARRRHGNLELRVMRDGGDTRGLGRYIALPDSELVLLHGVGRVRPVICGPCESRFALAIKVTH